MQISCAQNLSEALEDPVSINDTTSHQLRIISNVGIKANFPGGEDSLFCQIENRINQNLVNIKNIEGVILLQWTIDTLGNVLDVQANPPSITQKATHIQWVEDSEILEEFVRVYSEMPAWNPATDGSNKFESLCRQMIRLPYEYRCEEK